MIRETVRRPAANRPGRSGLIDSLRHEPGATRLAPLCPVLRNRGPFGAVLIGLLSSMLAGELSAAPPTLSHLFPPGGQRGTKVDVVCTGQFTWPPKIHAPGIEVVAGSESGKLAISIPEDLAADRVWIRLYDAEGASSSFPFLIGNSKEIVEQEPNNSPRNAQALSEAGVTINGVLQKGDVDGFAVPLMAGQTLVAAVDANAQLGSPIDAILQVVSPEGTVLAENHDDRELDPRLAFTTTIARTVIVRLFAFPSTPDSTIAYHGGPNCLYRLTLTTGPFVTHALPLAVPRESPGEVEALGWNIPAGTRLPVVPFGAMRLGEQPELEVLDELRKPPERGFGFAFAPSLAGDARVRLTPWPVVSAPLVPDPETPPLLALPTSVTGRLSKPGQSDSYRLALQKDQAVVVSVESRSLNLALDPVLSIKDPSGSSVSDVDDTGPHRDLATSFTATKDGEYRVTVSDRFRQGGERHLYLLTLRPEEPDFELAATSDAITVAPDKATEVQVKIVRRKSRAGDIGPITIEPIGLPEGVTAPAVVSETSGPTATTVKLQISTTGPAFSGPLRIVGRASQPRELERLVRTPAKLGATFDAFWLTVVEKKP